MTATDRYVQTVAELLDAGKVRIGADHAVEIVPTDPGGLLDVLEQPLAARRGREED